MNFQGINLPFLFESDENSANLIISYLTKKEVARFGQTCKQIREKVIEFQKDQYNEEYNVWRQNKMSRLKGKLNTKGQQNMKFIETDTNYIIKMRIFDIPLKFLEQKNWIFMNESDEQYVKKIKSDKFIKEYNNFFFKNKQYNDIIFINRSIIDQSLNFQESAFDDEEYEQTKYSDLYQGEEFSSGNYDFTNMQSLLSRQKQIISKMNKKELIKEQEQREDSSYLNQLQKVKKITIILCHGGYFSIGIFNEKGNVIFHKSDHKYVVRKKAGQRQLNCDSQSGRQVKSMGSQIRRDQEKKHQEKVHNILTDNIEQIENTDVVFLQAPGVNKLLLIRENEPLMRVQHKIRSICLTAKKANYTEVERIYKAITKIYLVLNK